MQNKNNNFITLNEFDQDTIDQARTLATTADISNYKHKNSLFYKENDKFINLDPNQYGVIGAAIVQFTISIFYKQSKENNKPIQIKYKTLKDHLGNDLSCSDQYIWSIYEMMVNDGIIIKDRQGKYKHTLQLTNLGYEMVFGHKFEDRNKRSYYDEIRSNKQPKIYEWISNKFRFFKKYNWNQKLRFKWEIVKKILLGIKIKRNEYLSYVSNVVEANNDSTIQQQKPKFENKTIDEIFDDDIWKKMFG